MASQSLINAIYLASAVLFILGLKGLTSPRTARRGNGMAAVGMLLAIVGTLLDRSIMRWDVIVAGLAVGTIVGLGLAVKIQMTAMPQMVAILNGLGGLASALVAAAAVLAPPEAATAQYHVSSAASVLIGAVTFTGSMIAFVKLQELFWTGNVGLPGHQAVNTLLALACLGLGGYMVVAPEQHWVMWALFAVSSVLGVLLVTPIGGADMPVVVALLNSYSGLAAAATGFVLDNSVLIISGSLVGASGLILTSIMCKAMNRSLTNVLFGKLEVAEGSKADADKVYAGKVKATSADELAMVLEDARRVVIVPGYGMAVSQAQHAVRELANVLAGRGAEVLYAIHPVAGRMPGHMNVLLAEADVAYDQLKPMEEINSSFADTDVSIVIGANDVVNPLARTDKGSPIYGMPILDVDKSRTVVVIKRSLSPGFAGIPNPLFAADNTLMFFGDGKKAIVETTNALKEL